MVHRLKHGDNDYSHCEGFFGNGDELLSSHVKRILVVFLFIAFIYCHMGNYHIDIILQTNSTDVRVRTNSTFVLVQKNNTDVMTSRRISPTISRRLQGTSRDAPCRAWTPGTTPSESSSTTFRDSTAPTRLDSSSNQTTTTSSSTTSSFPSTASVLVSPPLILFVATKKSSGSPTQTT